MPRVRLSYSYGINARVGGERIWALLVSLCFWGSLQILAFVALLSEGCSKALSVVVVNINFLNLFLFEG